MLSDTLIKHIFRDNGILPSVYVFKDPYLFEIDLIDGFFQTMRYLSTNVRKFDRLVDFIKSDQYNNILSSDFGIMASRDKKSLMIEFHKKFKTNYIAEINKRILRADYFDQTEIKDMTTDSIIVLCSEQKIKDYITTLNKNYHIRITRYEVILSKLISYRTIMVI